MKVHNGQRHVRGSFCHLRVMAVLTALGAMTAHRQEARAAAMPTCLLKLLTWTCDGGLGIFSLPGQTRSSGCVLAVAHCRL